MTEKYYVVPDLHGRYDLFKDALKEIYSRQKSGTIIFLGDYIDRGPNSAQIVFDLMAGPPEGWEFVCLKGNHEDMIVESYPYRLYDQSVVDSFPNKQISLEVRHWMNDLKLFHIVDKNIFVHAAWDEKMSPEHQSPHFCLWVRYSDSQAFITDEGYYLTHGHTPRVNGPIEALNRMNLDCGAVFYGRLVIGVYERDVRGPVEFITVTGPEM